MLAPGKRTSGRGKRGSSTTSLVGEPVWCFGGNEEAEHRKELCFHRRLSVDGREGRRSFGVGFKEKLWLNKKGLGLGLGLGLGGMDEEE